MQYLFGQLRLDLVVSEVQISANVQHFHMFACDDTTDLDIHIAASDSAVVLDGILLHKKLVFVSSNQQNLY